MEGDVGLSAEAAKSASLLAQRLRAIEADRVKAGRQPAFNTLDPVAHADAFKDISEPFMAALIDDARLGEISAGYYASNGLALRRQRQHQSWGRGIAWMMFLAVLATGAHALPNELDGRDSVIAAATFAQAFCLLVAALFTALVYLRAPRLEWLSERAKAEGARGAFYARAIRLNPGAASGVLAVKTAYLQVGLIENQKQYFDDKARLHARKAMTASLLYMLGLSTAALAAAPAFLEGLGALADAVAPGWLAATPALGATQQFLADHAWAWPLLGVFGAALLGLIAALSALDTSKRNARQYRDMATRLDALEPAIAAAERAAELGDPAPLDALADATFAALRAETDGWKARQEAQAET